MQFWASPESPSQERQPLTGEEAWGDWQLCLLILDLRTTPRGLVSASQRQNLMRQMGPRGKTSQGRAAKCPFPDPLRRDKRWSGSHFYRIRSHQAAFEEEDSPEESCSLERKKKIKLLKYKLLNCHQLACASGKKVGAKNLVPKPTLPPVWIVL